MAGTRHGGTMKVIGRDIGDALDSLYEELQRRVHVEAERELTFEPFEGESLSSVSWRDEQVAVRIHKALPTHALAHVVAVALHHVRQRLERYPDVLRPSGATHEEGPMLRQALRELVLSAEAEMQIESLELDAEWELEQRHQALKEMLRDPPPEWDEPGTPGNAFMALQYASFGTRHPAEMWEGLRKTFREQLAAAAEHGEGVMHELRKTGWGTLGGCLQSLIAARDELALQEFAVIEDRRSGEYH